MNMEELSNWVGREELREDVASSAPLRGMAATLDHATSCDIGCEVPPLWYWTYFLPMAPTAGLGEDGHPRKGGFLPPIPLPRRMWAGSRVEFLRPLYVGERISRRSTVANIAAKEGRTGPLVFVKVRHELRAGAEVAIVEEQDIVYRNPPVPGEQAAAAVVAPAEAAWRRRIEPTPVLLFRYSALTFNSHRIHFDREYAEGQEGYRGLVVHGPLIATLLLDLVRRELPSRRVREFSFRAAQPLMHVAPFSVCGQPQGEHTVSLWAESSAGAIATQATVRFD